MIKEAAIKDMLTGNVFTGKYHGLIIKDMVLIHGYKPPVDRKHHVQGFVTDDMKFVDRKEAAKIALACGQIKKLKYSDDELDSSDLN